MYYLLTIICCLRESALKYVDYKNSNKTYKINGKPKITRVTWDSTKSSGSDSGGKKITSVKAIKVATENESAYMLPKSQPRSRELFLPYNEALLRQ